MWFSRHVERKRKEAMKNPSSRRCNFTHELRILKALFNWYRENVDASFFQSQFLNDITLRARYENHPKRTKRCEGMN